MARTMFDCAMRVQDLLDLRGDSYQVRMDESSGQHIHVCRYRSQKTGDEIEHPLHEPTYLLAKKYIEVANIGKNG